MGVIIKQCHVPDCSAHTWERKTQRLREGETDWDISGREYLQCEDRRDVTVKERLRLNEGGEMILIEETGTQLWPPENCRSLVKIPLEEMESFYRFIVSCDELICKFLLCHVLRIWEVFVWNFIDFPRTCIMMHDVVGSDVSWDVFNMIMHLSSEYVLVSAWLCDDTLSGLTSWMYFTYRNSYLKIKINYLFTNPHVVPIQYAAIICYTCLNLYFIAFTTMLHIEQQCYFSINDIPLQYFFYYFELAFILIFYSIFYVLLSI